MNWVVFGVLLGLVFFNLLGVGIYHYEYKKDYERIPDNWKKDSGFWKWTVYILLFGTAYCVLRLIIWIKDLLTK
jgi:hypothetical protein